MLRLLIIDDEVYDNKCWRMMRLLEANDVVYDVAETLEEAMNKMFSSEKCQYDAIILDRSFPEKAGEERKGKAGDRFLKSMEEHEMYIPVLIHSTMLGVPDSRMIVAQMFPSELEKLQNFLYELGKKKAQ